MSRPSAPRAVASIFVVLILGLGLLLYSGSTVEPESENTEDQPGRAVAQPPETKEVPIPTPTRQTLRPVEEPPATNPGPDEANAPDVEEELNPTPTFRLVDEDGERGPAFAELDRKIAECMKTWPASEPALFHLRRYELNIDVSSAANGGVSSFSNVRFEVFIGNEEVRLQSPFLTGCVAGGVEDMALESEAADDNAPTSYTITGETSFDIYEQLRLFRADPERREAQGMTLDQVDELEQRIWDADPDRD